MSGARVFTLPRCHCNQYARLDNVINATNGSRVGPGERRGWPAKTPKIGL